MRDRFAALMRNSMSLVGSALALISIVLLLALIAVEVLGAEGHPYIGIITYMILPAAFLAGAILVIWGVLRETRRSAAVMFPVIDLNREQTRKRLAWFAAAATMCAVFLVITTLMGVEFMESNAFCGEVCHSVMAPEYAAYQRSPHARVHCVDCHVGSGTSWFVKSKLSGAWQVVSVNLGLYERPIPTPIHNLRPSKATCEQCHWPAKFHGVMPKVITRFGEDEANSETKTILLIKVGGHDFAQAGGIHWHTDEGVRIRYRSDPSRQTIHEVELTLEDGTVKRYSSQGTDGATATEWRTMDCIDCHNRPAHVFYGAEEAVDLVLERGFVGKDLPHIKREAVRAIRAEYASHEEARAGITDAIIGFYQREHPAIAQQRADDIKEAGRVLGLVYAANVFPTMNLGWNTYPEHLGHTKSRGCFRCHAGGHAAEDGDVIDFDCRTCHTIVAWDEASPEILEMLKR